MSYYHGSKKVVFSEKAFPTNFLGIQKVRTTDPQWSDKLEAMVHNYSTKVGIPYRADSSRKREPHFKSGEDRLVARYAAKDAKGNGWIGIRLKDMEFLTAGGTVLLIFADTAWHIPQKEMAKLLPETPSPSAKWFNLKMALSENRNKLLISLKNKNGMEISAVFDKRYKL